MHPSTESNAVLTGTRGTPQSTQAENYSALKAVWQSEWIEVCDCPNYGVGALTCSFMTLRKGHLHPVQHTLNSLILQKRRKFRYQYAFNYLFHSVKSRIG